MFNLEPIDPSSEKADGFYKAKYFINDITFGTPLTT